MEDGSPITAHQIDDLLPPIEFPSRWRMVDQAATIGNGLRVSGEEDGDLMKARRPSGSKEEQEIHKWFSSVGKRWSRSDSSRRRRFNRKASTMFAGEQRSAPGLCVERDKRARAALRSDWLRFP